MRLATLLRRALGALAMLAAASVAGAASVAPAAPHIAMTLVAETDRPAAGHDVTLALASVPEPGWHGYWKNGGDAGLETQLGWSLPRGVAAGALRYPVPGRLLVAGLMNYVYERPFAPFVTLSLSPALARGTTLPIAVKVDYLVCTTTLCVPESQTLRTTLAVGDGRIDPARRARFDAWRRDFPKPLGATASYEVVGKRFRLGLPFPAAARLDDAYFYPLASGAIDYAAPQHVTREGDRLVIETAAAPAPATGRVAGVLATGDGGGFAVVATPGKVAPAAMAAPATAWSAILLAFGGAVLGGLILNVMPCVFPILSLKALGLATGSVDRRAARAEALAYAAGVVLTCVGLGALLLALRAGGARVGWAFQLQDPRVIGVLLVLVVGIALNLTGLFELPTPGFAARSGAGGAFATGALAAFVATPCTGPFMGAALGLALVLPTAAALVIFAGLGLGIAIPFLAIGFVPAIRRRLPKPGAWMGRVRRILSIPMFLTALALAWILGRQAGVDGMTIGLGASLIAAVALWWTGRRQYAGRDRAWWPAVPGIAIAAFAVVLVRPAPAGSAAPGGGDAPFSEARLADLRANDRPVFAYFTADWCLTCKVNEQAAIDRAGVRRAFAEHHVAVLVGDWTDGDPALGRFIEAHNRAGVPLYLYYAPGAAEPRVLPQVLTTGMLEGLAA